MSQIAPVAMVWSCGERIEMVRRGRRERSLQRIEGGKSEGQEEREKTRAQKRREGTCQCKGLHHRDNELKEARDGLLEGMSKDCCGRRGEMREKGGRRGARLEGGRADKVEL
jgi:hypothetical protein